jgi:hypothetical protein
MKENITVCLMERRGKREKDIWVLVISDERPTVNDKTIAEIFYIK